MQEPPLPDFGSALFFDFDGTLTDIAEHPDAVIVAPEVRRGLGALASALAGAVAVVSGRPLAEIDHWLHPLRLPTAGVHGAERRGADGGVHRMTTPDLGPARELAEALVRRHPALRLESKPGALALHYRQAESLQELCITTMTEAARRIAGVVLLRGKMVVELKPQQADKGRAVQAFLSEAPFRSRRPWMFGDDVTDEAAFETVLGHGGVAVKVGTGATLAPYRLADPAALLGWMRAALDGPVRLPGPRDTVL